jgi:hypothetical protein
MNAKLELMREEAAAQKKCEEEGKIIKRTPGCKTYHVKAREGFVGVLDEEGLQLDLGKRLFDNRKSETIDQGGKEEQ